MKFISKPKPKKEWKVYLVECSDGTYYCGIAKDVAKRVHTHNQGKGAKYTMGRTPVMLLVVSPYLIESEAKALESIVKTYPKHKKASHIVRQWRYQTK